MQITSGQIVKLLKCVRNWLPTKQIEKLNNSEKKSSNSLTIFLFRVVHFFSMRLGGGPSVTDILWNFYPSVSRMRGGNNTDGFNRSLVWKCARCWVEGKRHNTTKNQNKSEECEKINNFEKLGTSPPFAKVCKKNVGQSAQRWKDEKKRWNKNIEKDNRDFFEKMHLCHFVWDFACCNESVQVEDKRYNAEKIKR